MNDLASFPCALTLVFFESPVFADVVVLDRGFSSTFTDHVGFCCDFGDVDLLIFFI